MRMARLADVRAENGKGSLLRRRTPWPKQTLEAPRWQGTKRRAEVVALRTCPSVSRTVARAAGTDGKLAGTAHGSGSAVDGSARRAFVGSATVRPMSRALPYLDGAVPDSPRDGRTPRAGRAPLLVAAGLIVVGSLTPWVTTAFGTMSGLAGGGLWTLYTAAFGIAATIVSAPRVAGVHALLMGVPAIVLPLWQLVRLLPLGGFGQGWTPGFGLVAVLGGGVLAVRTALRLLRR